LFYVVADRLLRDGTRRRSSAARRNSLFYVVADRLLRDGTRRLSSAARRNSFFVVTDRLLRDGTRCFTSWIVYCYCYYKGVCMSVYRSCSTMLARTISYACAMVCHTYMYLHRCHTAAAFVVYIVCINKRTSSRPPQEVIYIIHKTACLKLYKFIADRSATLLPFTNN